MKSLLTNLENLGNFPNYINNPKESIREDHFISKKMILKKYILTNQQNSFLNYGALFETDMFILREIREGKINPFSGLGFMILSENTLNLARWDEEIPYLLKNNVYSINLEKKHIKILGMLERMEEGAFCMWELGIVSHEKEAWKKYLNSSRKLKNKEEYLNTFFDGKL